MQRKRKDKKKLSFTCLIKLTWKKKISLVNFSDMKAWWFLFLFDFLFTVLFLSSSTTPFIPGFRISSSCQHYWDKGYFSEELWAGINSKFIEISLINLAHRKKTTKTTEKYCYPPSQKKILNRVFHLVQFEIWLYINLSVNKMFITEFTISIWMMHYSIYWFILSLSFSVSLSFNFDFFLFLFSFC